MSAAQTERVYELIFDIIDELNEKGIDGGRAVQA